MESFFLLLYRFIFLPTGLIIAGSLALLGNKKLKQGFKMRFPHGTDHPWFDLPRKKQPIWFHASSGEFEYAKPVITALKKKYPQTQILVTYFSPTYKDNIASFPGVDMSCPLPWDFPGPIVSFIKHHNPQALLIARTDLWPELLYQCHRMGIPSLLFSATKAPPKKINKLLKPFYCWLYSKINLIFSVSNEDRIHFLDQGAQVVLAKGDTRYDQVIARLQGAKPINKSLFADASVPILICGSTWSEDEKILLIATEELIGHSKLRLVIAPHEPTDKHLQGLEADLAALDLTYQYYTKTTEWNPQNVLIIDQVGILAELYTYGNLAFVGGSFKSSVHSVMEPLAAGKMTYVGPFHKNNREAIEFQNIKLNISSHPAMVTSCHSSEALKQTLTDHITEIKDFKAVGEEIKQEILARTGSSLEVIHWLEDYIQF